jgi:hypothetical protein
MGAINTITSTITNAPLHQMIEQMGVSVANAQAALDENSLKTLKALAEKGIEVNGETTNLLLLGFVPTFYAFTEASFEMKMEFSMAESEAFSVGASVEADFGIVAASVSASYSRKFDQSASIAARMVSLPPPENLLEMLKNIKPTLPIQE